MLNSVPSSVNAMARSVIENHPNTLNCQVFRRKLNRTEPLVGGIPTLGGLGVLDSEDEENIDYEWIGNGYALQAEPFNPSQTMDRQDANNSYADEIRFLIIPEDVDGFEVKKHDVIYLLIGDIVKLAWEVSGIETVINIPPYTKRYIMNRRNDLGIV